jgi:hypothetical protein
MWKPGQLVTINGRVYRVKRTRRFSGLVVCEIQCDIWLDNRLRCPVYKKEVCQRICFSASGLMPEDCYLVRIKPKSSIG